MAGEGTEARPEAQRSPKAPSLLGSTLGRLDWARAGEAIAGETTTPRSRAVDADLTKRITRRYRAEVEKTERDRLQRYVRLEQQVEVMPDQHQMARTVKNELENVQKKAGMEAISYTTWDDALGSEEMKKRLEFLSWYALNGESKEELPDVCYEGEFLYGLRHGKGKHTYQGEVYEGSWLWGQRHGKGVCIQTDGTKVIGSWKDGKLEGAVTIEGKTGGTLFEGEFKAGKRDGFGRQVFPNGDTYAGGWKDGIMHDRGVYHFANGDHLEGIWHEGKYHGPAYFRGADGSVSRRVYQNGVLLTCQDYFLESQKFSKEMSRDVMQKHTALWEYPKHALE
ncbi:unnamed protein product [Durusdinium trenchii]|uniref:Uncharacterized protein n=2 Tax=Durusdinium trenchii TaxID=1381693 RepID=A0ABP0JBN7_9DINO